MKWSLKEDEIVCAFYLSHTDNWRSNIDLLMGKLKEAGFVVRDENSAKMRVSNYAFLHTGIGLSNASVQSKNIYVKLNVYN